MIKIFRTKNFIISVFLIMFIVVGILNIGYRCYIIIDNIIKSDITSLFLPIVQLIEIIVVTSILILFFIFYNSICIKNRLSNDAILKYISILFMLMSLLNIFFINTQYSGDFFMSIMFLKLDFKSILYFVASIIIAQK